MSKQPTVSETERSDFIRTWFKAIRKSENLTQTEIAKLVDLDASSVNKYELGERQPKPQIAKKIAKVLNFEKYGADWTKFYDD